MDDVANNNYIDNQHKEIRVKLSSTKKESSCNLKTFNVTQKTSRNEKRRHLYTPIKTYVYLIQILNYST